MTKEEHIARLEIIKNYLCAKKDIESMTYAIETLKQEPKTDIEEKIHKMKSEIADSLEFWDYSPNNNPLARDMLETITNFWGEANE